MTGKEGRLTWFAVGWDDGDDDVLPLSICYRGFLGMLLSQPVTG